MEKIVEWLLDGDVSVQYMAHRWLLDSDESTLDKLQNKVALEGFGARLLSCQSAGGHWGIYYYQPKWTCTHYTLLELQSLCAPRSTPPCREMVGRMFDECMKGDGSLNLSKYEHPSDTCVDGMALAYSAWFCPEDPRVVKLAGHLLTCQKPDGGFTWDWNSQTGDPHTTICVMEGFARYLEAGPDRPGADIRAAAVGASEFLMQRGLFMDGGDGRFLKLSFPCRYRYDLLRALECFADLGLPFDSRMRPALEWLKGKRKPEGWWTLENVHSGNVHFTMEEKGKPSRFITAKALRILRKYPDGMDG